MPPEPSLYSSARSNWATGLPLLAADVYKRQLYPAFDKNGKYLYFTASTDTALSTAGLDMSSDEHRVSRSAYVAVLGQYSLSPLAPESDEEKAGAAEKEKSTDKDKDKDKEKDKDKQKDKDKDKDKSLSLIHIYR